MARKPRLLKDSITARINPLEAMVLRSIGGSGTTDPRGVQHFAMDSASSHGVERGDYGPGDRQGSGLGGGSGSRGGGSFGLGGALKGAVKGGAFGLGFGGPMGGVLGGLAGGVIGGFGGLGGAINGLGGMGGGLNFGGARGATDSVGAGGLGGGGGFGERPGGGGDHGGPPRTGGGLVPPAGTVPMPKPGFQRPPLGTPPAWMHFDPVMTALQKRSYIATQGVSGNQGLYRSSEAKDYYKNLLGQDFIGPTGGLQGDLNGLMPIEHQYLGALGIPQFNDVHGLLKGLGY